MLALLALGCATAGALAPSAGPAVVDPDPYPSTYRPLPSGATLIRGATVLTGTGAELAGADVLIEDGRIAAVGEGLEAPAGAAVVEAAGKWVTPGVIDIHSHLGVFPSPEIDSTSDGNEVTDPVTAEVWAEHSVWPQDPGFPRALAGGVTTLHVLPGSANLIGGRGVTLKNLSSRTVQGMKMPGAPYTLKMACGENPKRLYGGRNRAPSTRMGNVAGYRRAFLSAAEYRRKHERAAEGGGDGAGGGNGGGRGGGPPERDLGMETLVGVLDGEILVQMHCYRADEMAILLDLAREMGFRITAFHHAVEAYKIADLLAEEEVCAAMWADWWGFKLEAFDGVRENVPMVHRAGGCAIVHSDSDRGIQRLNQEAAKALAAGRRAGIEVSRGEAIRWITANPARALGIDGETGTLEPGKAADVVIWNRDPFSVYALAERVYLDGASVYDRHDAALQPVTDFELGVLPDAEGGP